MDVKPTSKGLVLVAILAVSGLLVFLGLYWMNTAAEPTREELIAQDAIDEDGAPTEDAGAVTPTTSKVPSALLAAARNGLGYGVEIDQLASQVEEGPFWLAHTPLAGKDNATSLEVYLEQDGSFSKLLHADAKGIYLGDDTEPVLDQVRAYGYHYAVLGNGGFSILLTLVDANLAASSDEVAFVWDQAKGRLVLAGP